MLLLVVMQADAVALVARARTITAAEQRCAVRSDETDITVCGLRGAARFRVPFIVHDGGDPRYESVGAERERLIHRRSPLEELGPFQVGGGMAGVSVSVGSDGRTGGGGYRKPAP